MAPLSVFYLFRATLLLLLYSLHTHTPLPFFFRSFFFCWCAWRMLFTSRYIIAISSFLPFHSPFFFFSYLFLFIYLFVYLFFFYSGGLFSLCSPSRLGTCSYTDKPIDKQEQQYKRVQRYNVRFLFHRRRRKRGKMKGITTTKKWGIVDVVVVEVENRQKCYNSCCWP